MNLCTAIAIGLLASCLGACADWHSRTVVHAAAVDGSDSRAAWSTLDQNRDGVLSMDELAVQRATGLLQDFGNADADHDGKVSFAEWAVWWPSMTRTPPAPSMARLNAPVSASDEPRGEAR